MSERGDDDQMQTDLSLVERPSSSSPVGRSASCELAASDAIGRQARRFVATSFGEWGVPELADRAALAVSELATNAFLHAGTGATITVELLDGGAGRVSVTDGSSTPPSPCAPGADEISGRGLLLVLATTDRSGYELLAGGKRVWFELDPTP